MNEDLCGGGDNVSFYKRCRNSKLAQQSGTEAHDHTATCDESAVFGQCVSLESSLIACALMVHMFQAG